MLADKIYTALRRAYEEAGTQEELQKKTGVAHSQISHLLNGRRSCGGLRVDTLEKLFPDMEISFFKDERHEYESLDPVERQLVSMARKLSPDKKVESLALYAMKVGAIEEAEGKKEKVADDEQELSAGA